MKAAFVASLSAFVLIQSSPVFAIDCTKASSSVDKLICATPNLKQADEAMGLAYFKLLRETDNPDYHEALIRSQRRWLTARADSPDRIGQGDDGKADGRKALLQITRARLQWLLMAVPIHTFDLERNLARKDSGGTFAGYRTECELLPPPYANWAYSCWTDVHRQNKDRICTSATDWASGQTTEYHLVSMVRDGEPHLVATCTAGETGTDAQCPAPEDDARTKAIAHWNSKPGTSNHMPNQNGLWKYDADVEPGALDQPWMDECVSAATYPPADVSRPAPQK